MNKLIKILILIQILIFKSSLAYSEYWGFSYKSATALNRISYFFGGSDTDSELATFKDSSGESLSENSEESLGLDFYYKNYQIGYFQQKTEIQFNMDRYYNFQINYVDFYYRFWSNIWNSWLSLCIGFGHPINGDSVIEDKDLRNDYFFESENLDGRSYNIEVRYISRLIDIDFDFIYGLRHSDITFKSYESNSILLQENIRLNSKIVLAGIGIGFK